MPLVPTLLLQPLVENAVKHGIESRLAPGIIRIAAEHTGRSLRLGVTDNGRGLMHEKLSEGVGLSNTRLRLHELYGDEAILEVHSKPGQGFSAEIFLPWRTASKSRVQQLEEVTA